MQVASAYASVVLIWATTPLAIKWSISTLSYIAAVSLRMLLALLICSALLLIARRPLVRDSQDWWAYLAGAVGLYPNMLIVHWSAQFIPSGLMSVIMGIYPLAVGVFSLLLLKENVFNVTRVLALLLTVVGLSLIHIEQISVSNEAIYGIVGMIVSSLLLGLSAVWLKAVGGAVDALRQSTGALVVATPAFLLTWLVADREIPAVLDHKSLMGVGYLAVAGSVVGHTLFFYVLRECKVMTVSFITLLTPLMALSIGFAFAGEVLTPLSILGCAVVVFSLAIYQGVIKNALILARSLLSRLVRRG